MACGGLPACRWMPRKAGPFLPPVPPAPGPLVFLHHGARGQGCRCEALSDLRDLHSSPRGAPRICPLRDWLRPHPNSSGWSGSWGLPGAALRGRQSPHTGGWSPCSRLSARWGLPLPGSPCPREEPTLGSAGLMPPALRTHVTPSGALCRPQTPRDRVPVTCTAGVY